MRKVLVATLVLLASAACSSAGNTGGGPSVKPELAIVQTSAVPLVARHEQGAINVQFAVGVTNHSEETITLKRVRVVSLSEGAYHVNHSMAYDVPIGPAQAQQVGFWAPARTGASLVGSSGPVTVRLTCEFDSPSGKFQQMMTAVVSEHSAHSN